jgi:predicted nucleic acid-binding protein
MRAYVDASVFLRVILGEKGALAEWDDIEVAVTSELAQVECLRTLDRLQLRPGAPRDELAARRAQVYRLFEEVRLVELSREVLARGSQPFPAPLGTLDALHLATALLVSDQERDLLMMATHDAELGLAARAVGLAVIGC